jgi:hypothetical protein
MTCGKGPFVLGAPAGVCFRASCPGVWGLLLSRLDQASFRRRFVSFRHYHFEGIWELVAQGTLEAGPSATRELFLVLPGDLIELTLTDPDPHARIEARSLGYIKTGCVAELQEWLAYHSYLENFEMAQRPRDPRQ